MKATRDEQKHTDMLEQFETSSLNYTEMLSIRGGNDNDEGGSQDDKQDDGFN